MTSQTIHPVLGVGFGPANLSLAVALEERDR
ncbi:SidA/IucD/PvdA family monooxygenase, partial [[Kitasatospora] papulosa]